MSTVRFSQVTFATKSWVAEAWEKMVVELFSGRVVAEANNWMKYVNQSGK